MRVTFFHLYSKAQFLPQAVAESNHSPILQRTVAKSTISHIADKGPDRSSQQCLLQNGFQPVAECGRCRFAFLQLGQQLARIAVVFLDGMWVLEIEVEIASLDLVDRNLTGDFIP